MSEMSREELGNLEWLLDHINLDPDLGGMSQEESGAALPGQLQEVLAALGKLPNMATGTAPEAPNGIQPYMINSDIRLPTPAEVRRELDQEGEK